MSIIIIIIMIVVSTSMVVCGVRRNIIFINISCVSIALVSVANYGHGVAVRGSGSYKYDNEMRTKSDINPLSHLKEGDGLRKSHDYEKSVIRRRQYDTRITRQKSNPLLYILSLSLRLLSMLVKSN